MYTAVPTLYTAVPTLYTAVPTLYTAEPTLQCSPEASDFCPKASDDFGLLLCQQLLTPPPTPPLHGRGGAAHCLIAMRINGG